MGNTNAPPSSTTFCPPKPVRTKARSFELRKYSQCMSHTTMPTTIATTIRPRMKLPNCEPDIEISLPLNLCEAPRVLGQCEFDGQALHRTRTVEAVASGALREHLLRVVGCGDRAAVAQHDHVGVDGLCSRAPGVDARCAIRELQCSLCADGAAGREAQMAHDDVRARAGHCPRIVLTEDVGCRDQIECTSAL